MIDGEEWFFQMDGAIFANLQKALRERFMLDPLQSIQSLAYRDRDRGGQAFSRNCGERVGKPVCFVILYVKAHSSTLLPIDASILPSRA